jgi:hypothetical protein
MALLMAGFATAQDRKPDPVKGEEVAGKITIDGKPVPAGIITYVSKDGKTTVSETIAADGTYRVIVPDGEYALAVASPPPPTKVDPKDPPKKLPLIPAKYGDPKTSGLLYKVSKGKQTYDIDLKSR